MKNLLLLLCILLLCSFYCKAQKNISDVIIKPSKDVTPSRINKGNTIEFTLYVPGLKTKSDSLKTVYAMIAALKAELQLMKKKDTIAVIGVPGAGIITKSNPLDLSTFANDILLLKKSILDQQTIQINKISRDNYDAKLSGLSRRITKLSKRIYRVERKLFGNKPPI